MTEPTEVTLVRTPRGPARAHLDLPAGPPVALVALGHGAGGGVTALDLLAVRDAVLPAGLAVARVEQPYLVAGRRAPAPAAALDEAWLAVVGWLRRQPALAGVPLVVGGRSSGARVACRTAAAAPAQAVVALAFPVHPPGRPERSRLAELDLPSVPVLVVQGDRDPFGLPPPAPGRTVQLIAGADHSLRRDLGQVGTAVASWLRHAIGAASR